MPVTKIVNAGDVLPPSLVKLIQQKLDGQGMLLYVPAVKDRQGPPETLLAVVRLTEAGRSAAQIAAELRITPRQVCRLRRQAREHPEVLTERPKRRRLAPHGAGGTASACRGGRAATPRTDGSHTAQGDINQALFNQAKALWQ